MRQMDNERLKMTFMPNTIEHLGVRLYSTIPPVIAELIANSYDADAKRVTIKLIDTDPSNKEIIVEDDGHGMSFDDINSKFLRIGRNRRVSDADKSPGGRLVIGKKGLGKLSFFGIANKIVVSTSKDSKRNVFELNWKDIINQNSSERPIEYEPRIIEKDVDDTKTGTTITLKDIKRITDFAPRQIATSISRFFIIDDELDIIVQHNNSNPVQVTNEMKYKTLDVEFEWKAPTDLSGFKDDYVHRNTISGKIFTTKKPIQPATSMRGITLFSRKKLVNLPEYFSDSTSSHFYSYLTGWLEVDFIDKLGEEVIGTNRQSLDWDNPDISKLRKYLQRMIRFLEKQWRKEREAKQTRKISDQANIDINEWLKTIPDEIKKDFGPILDSFRRNVDFPEKQNEIISTVKNLHGLIPEYPLLHWRYLHPTLKTAIEDCYKKGEYYTAVFEGVKKYITELQTKTASKLKDWNLLENIYALEKKKVGGDNQYFLPKRWSVIEKYKKLDNTDFDNETKSNIIQGHRNLVLAMWQAFRDPISHELVDELRSSGLYTEKDCLDALSLLSHLFRRLDDIQKTTTIQQATKYQ